MLAPRGLLSAAPNSREKRKPTQTSIAVAPPKSRGELLFTSEVPVAIAYPAVTATDTTPNNPKA